MRPSWRHNWRWKHTESEIIYSITSDKKGVCMTCILVIDDEPINHQLVAHALISLQCEMHFAENGKSGISQARTLKPDLIITDVMMPDITGYEVTRILRREPQFAVTPILVLTAQSDLQDKLKSFEAGADEHLTKPFETAELVVRVTSLLRRVEALRSSRVAVPRREARMIAVHSLRGGRSSSTLPVHFGVGLAGLWRGPALVPAFTIATRQVALIRHMTLKRSRAG